MQPNPEAAASKHLNRPLSGIALMIAAVACFAALDATSKHLTHVFSVPMLVWARYTVHCLLMVVFLAPSMRGRLLATRYPVANVLRALLLVGTTGFAMAGFSVMPLAEATAFLFVTPLLVVTLAGWQLGERNEWPRWIAVALGFGGALLIARPGGAMPPAGVALMSLTAVFYAFYQVQTRKLSATEDTVTMLFYTALTGTVVMSIAAPTYWRGPLPDLTQALAICSLGIFGGTGHFLLIRAFHLAPASLLSPFVYAQLIWAGLFGWIFFDQWPDSLSIVGMLVIAASSAWIAVARGTPAQRAGD